VIVFLADKSAWEQARYDQLAEDRLVLLREAHQLAICTVTAAELLYSSRNYKEFVANRADYDALRWMDISPEAQRRALDVMQALALRGQHRSVGIPDLLIAASAEVHQATVLHCDSDFERIAEVTGQPHEWIVPRGKGHGHRA